MSWNTGTGERYAACHDNTDVHVLGITDNSLTTLDSGAVGSLTDGAGSDGRFLSDDLIIATGSNGMQTIELDDDHTVIDGGIGRDTVRLAYERDLAVAATSDETSRITLWDVASKRQIGQSFSPLGSEVPRWIAFDAQGRLVVGGGARSAVVSLDQADWLRQACALTEALDPEAGLPPDPRLREFEACP